MAEFFPNGAYFREFQNAKRFLPNNTPPRLEFNGFVEFVFSPEAELGTDNAVFREQISSLVQTATLPSVNFKTEVKKQYNIKRVVNTGLEYNPISIEVVDTVNNEWLLVFMRYFSHLYMNPRNKTSGATRDLNPTGYESSSSVTTRNSAFMTDSFNSNAAGLNLTTNPNFIELIKIVLYHGGRGTEYLIFKPTLLQFDTGQLDYKSSQFRKFGMQFDYEGFTINNNVNFKLNETDKMRFEKVDLDSRLFKVDPVDSSDSNPIYRNSDTGTPVTVLGNADNKRVRDPQFPPRSPQSSSTQTRGS